MPAILLWVVWLSLCFAHIVRLVMPYSKRLPLSRGYLIVCGRQCFQESLFFFPPRPIKVAVMSGIWHANGPFSPLPVLVRSVIIERLLLQRLRHRGGSAFCFIEPKNFPAQKYASASCVFCGTECIWREGGQLFPEGESGAPPTVWRREALVPLRHN